MFDDFLYFYPHVAIGKVRVIMHAELDAETPEIVFSETGVEYFF